MNQGNSLVHLLEGPSDAIIRVLCRLSEHEHFQDPFIQSGRIVYCVEDRPQRFFPEWFSCAIQERRSQTDDLTSDTCKDIVHDLASGLLHVGKELTESQREMELNK